MKRTTGCIVSADELEMLTALHHLRYLTVPQIHQLWYGSRTPNACSVRVARLTAARYLHRTVFRVREGAAYSLGTEGLRTLRDFRGGAFFTTPALSEIWLPHHLATNAVFVALVQDSAPAWSSLPFTWAGTLSSALRFQETRRDAYGVLRKRNALLRPDATIEVGNAGPRIFLELDRSTEKLTEDDERRSIRRKLRAYATVIDKVPVDSRLTWYGQVFKDDRTVRVLFVLEKADDVGEHRRLRAIEDAAREVAPRMDVRCVYLRDVSGLRSACALGCSSSAPSETPSPRPTLMQPEDYQRLAAFYQLTIEAFRHRAIEDIALRGAATEARNVLRRLRHEMGGQHG